MCARPVIGTAAVFFGNLRVESRFALELQRTAGGDINVEGFVEGDVAFVEVIFGPELSGSQRRVNDRDHFVFQHLAGAQSGHGDVLLAVIRVNRGLALDGSAQVLHGVVAGLDHASVFFKHAYVRNLDPFVG